MVENTRKRLENLSIFGQKKLSNKATVFVLPSEIHIPSSEGDDRETLKRLEREREIVNYGIVLVSDFTRGIYLHHEKFPPKE